MAGYGWWERVIRSFSPRVCAPCQHFRYWVVYTDAATSPPPIVRIALQWGVRKSHPVQQLSWSVPTVWQYLFRSTCLISGIGILALVAFLEESDASLAGCSIWIYMGRNNSLSAMTRCDSNKAAISVLVARACELIRRHHILAWFSRVPSKLNPAGLSTREKASIRMPIEKRIFCPAGNFSAVSEGRGTTPWAERMSSIRHEQGETPPLFEKEIVMAPWPFVPLVFFSFCATSVTSFSERLVWTFRSFGR